MNPAHRLFAALRSSGHSIGILASRLPSGENINIALGTLNPLQEVTITFNVIVDSTAISQVCNQATISGTGTSGTPFNPVDTDDADPAFTGPADPTCTDIVALPAPDMVITKDDGIASVGPGGTIAYTIDYSNAGAVGANGVVLNETVPTNTTFNPGLTTASWVCTPNDTADSACTLNIGAVVANSAVFQVDFVVDVDDPLAVSVTEINNTATVTHNESGEDSTPSNNSFDETTPVDAAPDLVLAKDDGDATFTPGGIIIYTLIYSNVGNADATTVVLTDTVPEHTTFNLANSTGPWSCADNDPAFTVCTINVGTVAGNVGGGSFNFAVNVDSPLASNITVIGNTASIVDDGANGVDPNTNNNEDSDNTPRLSAVGGATSFLGDDSRSSAWGLPLWVAIIITVSVISLAGGWYTRRRWLGNGI